MKQKYFTCRDSYFWYFTRQVSRSPQGQYSKTKQKLASSSKAQQNLTCHTDYTAFRKPSSFLIYPMSPLCFRSSLLTTLTARRYSVPYSLARYTRAKEPQPIILNISKFSLIPSTAVRLFITPSYSTYLSSRTRGYLIKYWPTSSSFSSSSSNTQAHPSTKGLKQSQLMCLTAEIRECQGLVSCGCRAEILLVSIRWRSRARRLSTGRVLVQRVTDLGEHWAGGKAKDSEGFYRMMCIGRAYNRQD